MNEKHRILFLVGATMNNIIILFSLLFVNVFATEQECTSLLQGKLDSAMQENSGAFSGLENEDTIAARQIGVIKGGDIPQNCIFSKLRRYQYKQDALYAILAVTNISDREVCVWAANPPFHYVVWHDYRPTIDLLPQETICFFIEIDPASPVARLRYYVGEINIPLNINAPYVMWDTVQSPSQDNISLTIVQKEKLRYSNAFGDYVILQASIASRCNLPVEIQLVPNSSSAYSWYSILNTNEPYPDFALRDHFHVGLTHKNDSFVLLPCENIVSENFLLNEIDLSGGREIIMDIERKKLNGKRIRVRLDQYEVFSPPLLID